MSAWNKWRASAFRIGCALALIGAVSACSGTAEEDSVVRQDSLTRQQRDSALGASSLPGAAAVQRALDVSDSAAARLQAIDSVGGM